MMFEKVTSLSLLHPAPSVRLTAMPGLPPDHERYARAALPGYGRDRDAPLRLLSLSENATYLADDGDPMVLAIRSELKWMAALREQTPVVTPELIPARDGSDVVAATVAGNTLHVDAVTFISGCTAEEQPDVVGFDELGRITAAMHGHVKSWTAPDYFTRFRWDVDATIGRQARWGNWRHAPGLTATDEAIVERAAAEVGRRLTEFGYGADRFGLIHADLRMANLMVDPDPESDPEPDPESHPESDNASASITVIDFDDCGWSWYLFDLAAVVSFIEDTPEAERMIADWLRGYLEVRDIPAEQLEMIPTLVLLRRLMLTAWVASHADADAAIAFTDGYATGTALLANRYLTDRDWLRDAVYSSRV
jgi:Ser/Thr protein kinase RdoA (MazF antagonist)